MTPEIVNWIIVGLFVLEIAALFIWRRDKYPRVIFNEWAISIYFLAVPVTFLIGSLLSQLLLPADVSARHVSTLNGLALVGGLFALAALLLTLFFRWIVNTDLSEPPK